MVYVCTLPFILVHEVGVFAVVPTTALLSLALFGTGAAEQSNSPSGTAVPPPRAGLNTE